MARGFVSADSERLYHSGSPPASALPLTFHCRFFAPASIQNNQWLFTWSDASAALNYFGLQTGGSGVPGQMRFWASSNSSASALSSNTYNNSAWNYCTGAAVATDDRWINLNGTKTTNATSVAAHTFANLDTLAVGAITVSSTTTQYLDGSIAEVAVWNVELSDAEVASLNAGFAPTLIRPSALVSYIPLIRSDNFDRVSGQAYSTDGTPTTEVHPPVIRASSPFVAPLAAPAAASDPGYPFRRRQPRPRITDWWGDQVHVTTPYSVGGWH